MTTVAFYQLPKSLFTDPKYQSLSIEAKTLYSVMRDRLNLSIQNNWRDKTGVYIKMTRKYICDILKRSEPTVRKIIAELRKVGLLIEKRVGLTQANKIYVQLLAGEDEKRMPSSEKNAFTLEKKLDFVPERKDFSRNKSNQKEIKYRKLPTKPSFPRNGDIWEENGQEVIFHHGYIQRFYSPEIFDQLVVD